jgi:hypothetical protein
VSVAQTFQDLLNLFVFFTHWSEKNFGAALELLKGLKLLPEQVQYSMQYSAARIV